MTQMVQTFKNAVLTEKENSLLYLYTWVQIEKNRKIKSHHSKHTELPLRPRCESGGMGHGIDFMTFSYTLGQRCEPLSPDLIPPALKLLLTPLSLCTGLSSGYSVTLGETLSCVRRG